MPAFAGFRRQRQLMILAFAMIRFSRYYVTLPTPRLSLFRHIFDFLRVFSYFHAWCHFEPLASFQIISELMMPSFSSAAAILLSEASRRLFRHCRGYVAILPGQFSPFHFRHIAFFFLSPYSLMIHVLIATLFRQRHFRRYYAMPHIARLQPADISPDIAAFRHFIIAISKRYAFHYFNRLDAMPLRALLFADFHIFLRWHYYFLSEFRWIMIFRWHWTGYFRRLTLTLRWLSCYYFTYRHWSSYWCCFDDYFSPASRFSRWLAVILTLSFFASWCLFFIFAFHYAFSFFAALLVAAIFDIILFDCRWCFFAAFERHHYFALFDFIVSFSAIFLRHFRQLIFLLSFRHFHFHFFQLSTLFITLSPNSWYADSWLRLSLFLH